ncbi:hypothetical protein [Streptomyces spongiae]|uniref:Uncharacterized protein n=1 Tax=Streptomyces spongiae TaxID=565072 RepID=A0A5N8XFN1_9ACTN|nr:hypothetical protein [Streptomyces spongiae]MPY58034.1 hypothetical protein [Streptomyces spongiae]
MSDPRADIAVAEAWFRRRGLPWFIDAVDERVRKLLRRRWLWLLLAGVAVLSATAGWLTELAVGNVPSAVLTGLVVAIALLLAYAGKPLRVTVIAGWAARRAGAELDLLLPLITRALPLLMLFMITLFVNTEVWQVASSLHRPGLYATVLVFAGAGLAFLLTRLPEEVRQVQHTAATEGFVRACRGTPLEERARLLADLDGDSGRPGEPDDMDPAEDTLSRTQKANLLLVLLLMQAIQVLLLVIAVFLFFIVFGMLAISPAVVEGWVGHPPTPIVWNFDFVVLRLPVTSELYQVSVFLSVFAGLYFTVYAVSDAQYRTQFFGELSRGLEQAIGVREVYRTLLRTTREEPSPVGGRPDDDSS